MPAPYALHLICPSPSPYNAHLFTALGADPAVDLAVHYVNPSSASRPWRHIQEPYAHRDLRRTLGVDARLLRIAADRRNRLLVQGWNTLAQGALLLELALLRRPYLFWTDTPNLARRRSPALGAVRTAVARMVFRSASAVMSTGAPGVTALRAMGCSAGKAVNMPCFCDLGALQRGAVGVNRGRLRIASCGRLAPVKAYETALHAVSQLKRAAGGATFRYDIAGVGPEEARLRALAARLGLATDVHFRGWLEADATHALLKRCDLFLHPAVDEPYGVAVIEAMAAGAAVLGSDACGAVRDRIVHDRNGLVHPAGCSRTLAAQLIGLAQNRERLRAVGAAAAATAREWPVERGVRIITRLLAQTGEPPGARPQRPSRTGS